MAVLPAEQRLDDVVQRREGNIARHDDDALGPYVPELYLKLDHFTHTISPFPAYCMRISCISQDVVRL